jgi:hypothetical protein
MTEEPEPEAFRHQNEHYQAHEEAQGIGFPIGGTRVEGPTLPEGFSVLRKYPEKTDGFPLRKDVSLSLWKRILAWCQYMNWYAPDRQENGVIGSFYENGMLVSRELTHDPQAGFEFPPATEEQLRQAEKQMGFLHPPFLRVLYLKIANGGFGPRSGLIGVPGGFCEGIQRDPRYDTMIKESLIRTCGEPFCQRSYPHLFDPHWIDLEEREQVSEHPQLIGLTEQEWPTHFLNLCGGDYEEGFYVHAKSGRVYLAGNAYHHERTVSGEEATTVLHLQANSLEEWFEQWLNGERVSVYYDELGNILRDKASVTGDGLQEDFDPWLALKQLTEEDL